MDFDGKFSASAGAIGGATGAGMAASTSRGPVFVGLVTGVTVLAAYAAEYLLKGNLDLGNS